MAQIDKLLELMAHKQAERVLLVGDHPMRIAVNGQETTGATVPRMKLRTLAQEIIPEDQRRQMATEGRSQFIHKSPYGSFHIVVVEGKASLQISIESMGDLTPNIATSFCPQCGQSLPADGSACPHCHSAAQSSSQPSRPPSAAPPSSAGQTDDSYAIVYIFGIAGGVIGWIADIAFLHLPGIFGYSSASLGGLILGAVIGGVVIAVLSNR